MQKKFDLSILSLVLDVQMLSGVFPVEGNWGYTNTVHFPKHDFYRCFSYEAVHPNTILARKKSGSNINSVGLQNVSKLLYSDTPIV